MSKMSQAIKERPMLFSGSMVRALLDGRKTQTRRIIKPQPEPIPSDPGKHWWACNNVQMMVGIEGELRDEPGMAGSFCPYGGPGDRLWVRETFKIEPTPGCSFGDFMMGRKHSAIYKADDRRIDLSGEVVTGNGFVIDVGSEASDYPMEKYGAWRPSIHMPRWASRITLEITDVRLERLNEISPEDAKAEGVGNCGYAFPRGNHIDIESFARLWESINGPGSWDINPWVWALTFRKVES